MQEEPGQRVCLHSGLRGFGFGDRIRDCTAACMHACASHVQVMCRCPHLNGHVHDGGHGGGVRHPRVHCVVAVRHELVVHLQEESTHQTTQGTPTEVLIQACVAGSCCLVRRPSAAVPVAFITAHAWQMLYAPLPAQRVTQRPKGGCPLPAPSRRWRRCIWVCWDAARTCRGRRASGAVRCGRTDACASARRHV